MNFALGQTLKELRLKNNLTIKKLALTLNIPYHIYKEIEHNERLVISVYSLDKLSQLYNVKPTFILTGTNTYDDCEISELPLTINDYFLLWYYKWISIKRPEITVNFVNSYQSQAVSILKRFGYNKLDEITKTDIQNYLDTQTFKSKRTLSLQRSIIKQIFDCAADCKVYQFNLASNVKIPKNAKIAIETQPIRDETKIQILKFKHKLQPAAVIMLLAGLRRGELLALTYGDINLYDGYILVNKAVVMTNNGPTLENRTKTKNGIRKIDMPQMLISFLLKFLGENPQIKKTSLVLPNSHGTYMSSRTFNRNWHNYICEMNAYYGDFSDIDYKNTPINCLPMKIENFTSKQLRHTYLCSLYNAGVEPITASKLMGHGSVSFTLSTYYHLDAKYKKKNLEKFDNYLNQFDTL